MEERAYDEGVMEKAGEYLADERLKAFDEMNEEEQVFSGRFEEKKEKLFRRAAGSSPRGRITGRKALRIIAVCAAAVLLMTVSVMAVPPVRGVLDGFRTRVTAHQEEDDQNHYSLTVETDGGPFVIVGGEPTYVPEGYELTTKNEDGSCLVMNYTNSGEWQGKVHLNILFERTMIREENFEPGFVYKGVESEAASVRIGIYEGGLVRFRSTEGADSDDWAEFTKLVWSDSCYLYELQATTKAGGSSPVIPLPYEELLRMAESVSHDAVAAADESVLFGFIPEEEGEPVTEGICPRCGKAEIEAVCSHDVVLNSAGEPLIEEIPGETGADGTETGTMRRAEMCYTDHVCPGCGYRVSGGRDDCHVEWLLNETGDKIPVCPYREKE